ncbi:hypothetical protein [Asticcacaulis sp. EMRT-3]|uniref:hypothetical protein n=1 Tax=Asticcacaulis sp. EMRT-3 TaxID=3040349 RepID=UPI0024AF72EF|nr:hypothetical protein [Asticcacaulis sp. EMRT-3]MDI7775499.1 hypothetical protein [Asticcacaulis sp. EMRT-3]
MRNIRLATLGLASFLPLLSLAAAAQTIDPASLLGQFRADRAKGMQALDWRDPNAAYASFEQAQGLIPDSPSILLLEAQTALKQDHKDVARAALTDYLKRGFLVDLKQNPEFNPVWNADMEALQKANAAPVGEMHVAATLPGFTLADGLAYVPEGQQLFISTLRNGKIILLQPSGGHDVITFRPSVAASGLGLHGGLLWVATAATRQTTGYDPKADLVSKIVTVDPADGTVKTVVTADKNSQFGHLLAGKDDLYVVDAYHSSVLRLNDYTGELQTLIPEGYMDSPQGLAENEDGSVLIVSDFISGLYRIDLQTGEMSHLAPPADGSLLGITSLSLYGHDLIAVQNGFKPNKILHLHMSDDWKSVTSSQVVLRGDSQMSQPAQGLVDGDHFIFVARSQWDNLDDGGNAISDKPEPATIGAVSLKP